MTDAGPVPFADILPVLRREYELAVAKHPEFAWNHMRAVSIITEELGELAKELNDYYISPGAEDRAMIEAAHVAVTAIRTMQMLSKERKNERI